MKKGFTLIELLIVIAIIAALAVGVVAVLNPAELIRQGRDSTRISDMASINSALALYLSDFATPDLGDCATTLGGRCTAAGTTSLSTTSCSATSTTTTTGGAGWVDVNIGNISGGAPISRFPIDPVNTTTYFYVYECSESPTFVYELNANMESVKYANTGNGDVESKDGGSSATWYEIGNDPGLDL